MYSAAFAVYSTHLLLFFFNDTATTEIYTLSLHDALPIFTGKAGAKPRVVRTLAGGQCTFSPDGALVSQRSEEHTSELQSHSDLVCRLLLEKKKKHTSKRHSCENYVTLAK